MASDQHGGLVLAGQAPASLLPQSEERGQVSEEGKHLWKLPHEGTLGLPSACSLSLQRLWAEAELSRPLQNQGHRTGLGAHKVRAAHTLRECQDLPSFHRQEETRGPGAPRLVQETRETQKGHQK